MPRYLIVKLADTGDLLTITPALRRLRAARPDAELHLLATAHSLPVLRGSGLVDAFIPFDKFAFDRARDLLKPGNIRAVLALAWQLRGADYEAVFVLHHLTTRFGAAKYAGLALSTRAPKRAGLNNGRGWFLNHSAWDAGFGAQNEAACWLEVVDLVVGQSAVPRTPVHFPLAVGTSAQDHAWARAHLPDIPQAPGPQTAGPRIAIHTGSGGFSLARRWDPARFAAVADQLHQEHGAQIVVVGRSADDAGRMLEAVNCPVIDLVDQTSLGQLAAVLSACDLFIGADSGVMHLAAAAGTRVLAIFGPSNAAAWGPWVPADRLTILRSNPPCSPCSYVMRTLGQRNGCPARTCMQMVTVEGVVQAARKLLAGEAMPTLAARLPHALPDARVSILGIPHDPLTYSDLRAVLGGWIESDRQQGQRIARQVCTVNPELTVIAQQDAHFFTLLQRVDLCTADGQGLLWAARWLGHPLPERVTGSDGLPRIAAWAAAQGWQIFLLGAAEGVAAQAAAALAGKHPGLQIVGTHAGSPSPAEEDALVQMVNASGADILFVAYGSPQQEKWIARNLPRLEVSAVMGVGAAFDFLAGVQRRAPVGWQRLGLEWFYRLLREPWRWRRMLRLPRFVLMVLRRGARGPARFVGPRGSGAARGS